MGGLADDGGDRLGRPAVLDDDSTPSLKDRLRDKAAAAGMLVCGPNGMGFYNARDGVWMCGFDTRENHARGGNVTLISQSGAGMLVTCPAPRWQA